MAYAHKHDDFHDDFHDAAHGFYHRTSTTSALACA
jgi:hypothetical protein